MTTSSRVLSALFLVLLLPAFACDDSSSSDQLPSIDTAPPQMDLGSSMEDQGASGKDLGGQDSGLPVQNDAVYALANQCLTVNLGSGRAQAFLGVQQQGRTFGFGRATQTVFHFRASDLGTYLLYDPTSHYVVWEEGELVRKKTLLSDILTIDDSYLPGAQWVVEASSEQEGGKFKMKNLKAGAYLTSSGELTKDRARAAVLSFLPASGCAEFPELTLDAEGEPRKEPFEDGSLFGVVDTHSHLLSNFGFGGGGLFHGSTFHPLGVEHALPSCELYHKKDGRGDLMGFGFDRGSDLDETVLITSLIRKKTPEFNHNTEGYPEFTDWPNAYTSSTHQTQYYRWLERAWMGGLRLVIQHATTNQVICDLIVGSKTQRVRYSCNDMVAVDRILLETRNMERYIDAQHGGPGKGWFRIVTSPTEAREVVAQGKLAVVLGIETSHLFDCFLTPPEGGARCTEQEVLKKLESYWDKGVRVMFPVHKYDNGFSAGDGSRGLIEIGNFTQSGHWSNFTQDCPDLPSTFDKGPIDFKGLNMPRQDYFAQAPEDLSKFPSNPVGTLSAYLGPLTSGGEQGDFCQSAGLTPLGEFLLTQMMRRGMVIELDHLPRRGYARAFELLKENDYPGVGTHGNNNRGKLYELGGVSKSNFGRCNDPEKPGSRLDGFRNRLSLIRDAGGFEAEGFGFDLNGFAGAPAPRFGKNSPCSIPQSDRVTYPFESYGGLVTFTQPKAGDRVIDFNTEGLAHIGLLPELIQDLKSDGATSEDLEPLFKSAEGYIKMWEKSERRAKELSTK